jgi:cell division septation protein DedD
MEPALKQRLVGAMVLVALAVIFLPMLIKGPAPASGVSEVSLTLPDAPQGEYETRELPLVTPGKTPSGGALGMTAPTDGDALPTVDTTTATSSGSPAAAPGGGMLPAATAGGDYAVSFGSYASSADAARVVAALTASQLPGFQERVGASGGRSLYRVRIGPYASQAEAEAARLRAAHVRDDVGARVVVLDAGNSPAAAATASVSQPSAIATPKVSAPVALAATKPAGKTPEVAPPKPSATAKPAVVAKAAAPVPTAAAGVGFAVQLGAFGSAAEAGKLRDRARAAGFSAFVQDVRTDKGMLSRVRVGPVLSRADADLLKAQVSAKLGISGIVQSHP